MKNIKRYIGLLVPVVILTGFLLVSQNSSKDVPFPAGPSPSTIEQQSVVSQNESARTPQVSDSAFARPGATPTNARLKNYTAEETRKVTINNKEYPLRTYRPLVVPNDPSANQWWVSNARLNQAWDIPSGATPTTLAIIDSGFALSHEDFAGRWHVNSLETGPSTNEGASALNCTDRNLAISASCNLVDENNDGIVDNEVGPSEYQNPSRLNCSDQGRSIDKSCNRIDDDGNDYVDDVRGWDFINYDNAPEAGELNPVGEGTTHGTRVAGIAAATGNNAKGIAGVDWATKILPIQALDDDSYGDTLSVGRSIYYAVEQGADVISISLGSELPDDFVREAVRDALAAGTVVVAAAGNDGCECILYPANYPEVVAVGALGTNSQPAGFSAYGQNLDILAPGTSMISTNWISTNQTSSYVSGIQGTSFATPLVSGLLTRIKSQQPTATPSQLIGALTESVNRATIPASVPVDSRYGFGIVDAQKTTSRMTVPKTGITSYVFTPVSKGNLLNPSSPTEPIQNALVYACENGTIGSTPLFELVKGTSQFFTMSRVEQYLGAQQGYATNFVTYACLGQPHDTNGVMRSINVFHELRNVYPKPAQ